MVYRDPTIEGTHLSRKVDADNSLISRRSDIVKKKFDFINHQGPPRKIDSDPLFAAARNNKGKTRDWNLLSHLNHIDHTKVPIRYEEDDRLELQKKFPLPARKGRDPGRDFNIVSGKFKQNDDSRQEKIASDIRDTCEKKYWKTHSYDFIKVKSCDPLAQIKFEQHVKALESVQGLAQEAKLPHRYYDRYNLIIK